MTQIVEAFVKLKWQQKATAVLGLKITRDFLVSRDVDMYSCLKKKN